MAPKALITRRAMPAQPAQVDVFLNERGHKRRIRLPYLAERFCPMANHPALALRFVLKRRRREPIITGDKKTVLFLSFRDIKEN
jgi:hypothetical protein